MKPQRVLGFAWKNMKKRRLRTGLTTLGIVIGIMALVGIATLSAGFEAQMSSQITSGFDADIITVSSMGGFIPGGGGGSPFELNTTHAADIEAIPGVEVAMALAQSATTAYNATNESLPTRLMAFNITRFELIYGDKVEFASGGWPAPAENESCVLGYLETPFAQIGDNITVSIRVGMVTQNVTMTVSGLLDEVGQLGMTSIDGNVLIPLDVYQDILDTDTVNSIIVKISDPNQADTIADLIRTYFDDDRVQVIVPTAMIEAAQGMLGTMDLFLYAIASVAMLVAGISILNIMLVSVIERTREIGILKAIGARSRTVLGQFLGEAMLVGILGGLIGIVFGYGMGFVLVQMLGPMMSGGGGGMGGGFNRTSTSVTIVPVLTPNTIAIALLFSVLVSVIFALYPAYKAARLEPVRALRYE
jgi:putative ABC transport system permease protein